MSSSHIEVVLNTFYLLKAAYTYEIENDPVTSDERWDEMCRELDFDKLDPEVRAFIPEDIKSNASGMWIHAVPEHLLKAYGVVK